MVIVTAEGRVLGTHSWVDGFTPVTRRRLVHLSEDEAINMAIKIAEVVSEEAGDLFLWNWSPDRLYEEQ